MIVLLDENKYFTGSYAEIGGIVGGIEVAALPETDDVLKQQAYKYENGIWVYDEEKYKELVESQEREKRTDSIEKIRSDVDYIAMASGVELA